MVSIAISPCPNDTFTFFGLLQGFITKPPALENLRCDFFDIQNLNEAARARRYDIIKVSFAVLSELQNDYVLLPVGSALGVDNGPKIVARRSYALEDLPQLRIAVPGRDTTAHMLLNRLCPKPKEKRFCLYHEVEPLIASGKVDCGLIIHETRFQLSTLNLIEVCDLGQLWQKQFDLPLPLGCLVANKSLGSDVIDVFTKTLQSSLQFAWNNPQKTDEFVLTHSIEKNLEIIHAHIKLYVTQDTYELLSLAREAIAQLLSK